MEQEHEVVKAEEIQAEVIPSMDDFQEEIANSFRKLSQGDIVEGTVIGLSDTEVTVDLGSYSEGIIPLEELSNDPRFSIKADIPIGERVKATVLRENKEGSIILSLKKADDILAWETLTNMMEQKEKAVVKVSQAVKGGVITFLNGIRAFIPASQLTLDYVEDLDFFVNKELEVIIITVDEEKKKLVLSGKEVEKEKAQKDKNSRISKLQKGLVLTGKVEKIMPFGAFVSLGGSISGLVHISQICDRRIKTPNEVLKEGEEVTVKVLDIKEGKVSLSIKEVQEKESAFGDVGEAAFEYSTGEGASTSLASLLAGFKLPE